MAEADDLQQHDDLDSHLRETFGQAGAPDELDRLSRLARSFLK